MNRFFTIIFFGLISFAIQSQETQPSKIIISKNENGHLYFDYFLNQGETAYSIGRKFNQPVSSIKRINKDRNLSSLSQNESIRIPYSKEILMDSKESAPTALVYITEPKETLYSIGKKHFQIDIKELRSLNKLMDNNIQIGQELIIGYVDLKNGNKVGIKEENEMEKFNVKKDMDIFVSESSNNHEALQNTDSNIGESRLRNYEEKDNTPKSYSIEDLIEMIDDEESQPLSYRLIEKEDDSENIELTSEKGLAYTENVNMEGNDLFVLHPNAKAGTEMEITYPMLNKTVKARVISEFPKELYPKNISIVISPSVAEALGAKDNQFRVEMKFITD